MKRKSRPLITGGLLGLAGLGLLPSRAEATPENLAVVPEPSLGTDLAVDPHPVVVPEPSAQATEPQLHEQGAPQPAWTPDGDRPVVAAATAAQQPVTAAATVDISQPEATAIAPAVAPNPALVSPEPPASTLALPVTPAPAPEVIQAEMTEVAETADSDQAAIASHPIGTPATPVVAENLNANTEAAPTVTPAETLTAISAKPAASKPAQALQLPEVEPHSAIPAAIAATASEDLAATSTLAIAPHPAPAAGVAASGAAPRQATDDVAGLRSRATTVQALLRDLRTAYGLEIQSAPARQVSQPETVSRGPQLPPLPSRADRTAAAANTVANQIPVAAPLSSLSVARQTVGPEPQLPSFADRSPNVTLALPRPQPTLSTGRAALAAPPVELAAAPLSADTVPAVTTAQTTPSTPDTTQLRNGLRVAPLTTAAEAARSFPPSPNAGIPSAFGANWGDVFFSASLAGADRIRPEADGSLSMGFGLGDSRRAVGVELAYNLQSVRRFGENGGFDAKVHRQVYSSEETQVAAAVGLNNFASYGTNAGGGESSLYGVVTAAHLLQPEHPYNRLPITASLGLGGGAFSGESSDVGVFAGVGLQVHPQFSINTAWSGVGVNVGASIVPVTTLPLTLNLLYGDIGNNTRAGSVAVLSIGYGFNFGPQF
ncbi:MULTISPECIES: hypothetical protein [Cyanophyceae]|uniref:hypothetical protein n=1 Tax=Cyanophyceae TaxID=3028117 RepID=UPI0016840259|nr:MULTISPECIES: hypothetical protein [Cyanophyceae]MBD1917285.1 hypothetical protein [Phormidium sp. FACHB-77]MBD2032208.1 hypothetical protein [Phormidium sp. FACHB-322]MBD2053246.1 hypothetical protein [Leptolyngbya sp. FACHB-60]